MLYPKNNSIVLSGNKKCEIKWRTKDLKNNPTIAFVINYFKTYIPSEGISVKKNTKENQ